MAREKPIPDPQTIGSLAFTISLLISELRIAQGH